MFEKKRTSTGSVLVVGCSGCTRCGHMAHDLASDIATDGFAEPACLAAIGAGYDQDMKAAQHARGIIVIDGCDKACARKMLEKAMGRPMMHACVLTDLDKKVMDGEGGEESLFADLKRTIKIRYAQNRMLMSSMCDCGCVRG